MDAIPPNSPGSELPARDKRTLRDAVDGSPARPDGKVGRRDDGCDDAEVRSAAEESGANHAIHARCA